jgi:hypothetical protein
MILVEFLNLTFELEADIKWVSNVKFIPLGPGSGAFARERKISAFLTVAVMAIAARAGRAAAGHPEKPDKMPRSVFLFRSFVLDTS